MTGIAVYGGMSADQREPVEVLINLLHRNMPAPNRVALLAVRAHLALVDVGVAILAALADVGEDRFHVTLRAGYGLVHSAQGIAGLVVIEFRNSPDWAPGA